MVWENVLVFFLKHGSFRCLSAVLKESFLCLMSIRVRGKDINRFMYNCDMFCVFFMIDQQEKLMV